MKYGCPPGLIVWAKRLECSLIATFGCVVIFLPHEAIAQELDREERFSGFLGIGGGVAPEYEGADEYRFIPAAVGRVDYRGFSLQLDGLEARADLVPLERFEAGPAIRYRFRRDDDVEDNIVAELPEVDDAIEVGGFVGVRFPNLVNSADAASLRLTTLQDVSDAHRGYLIRASIRYQTPLSRRLLVSGDVSASYASEDFMSSYFDVRAEDSLDTGLSQFEADEGIKDVNFGLNVAYQLTERWGIGGRFGYSRLVGDAADSPIVEEQGSANQFITSVTATFRF